MTIRRVTLALAVALVGLSGCASTDGGGSSTASATAGVSAGAELTTSDAWVKAAGSDSTMTAVFVTLKNATDKDITVTSATTDMSSTAELHEMVEKNGQMTMQEAKGGFVVPAGTSLELKPGGFHIMVMQLGSPVAAGDKHTVTLTLGDGSEVTFDAIAKDFSGAQESYHSEGAGHGG